MQVSCPEVARLIFDGGLEIYKSEEIKSEDTKALKGLPEALSIHAEKLVMETLDATDYDLNIRLYHIGKSICNIVDLLQEDKLSTQKLEIVFIRIVACNNKEPGTVGGSMNMR